MRLRVVHKHTPFWPILPRFVDYYSLFWGPGVISTINKHPGALMIRLSALTVFVDSDPFRGLLRPKTISMVVEPQGALKCRSSTIVVGPILALFLVYHSDLGVLE